MDVDAGPANHERPPRKLQTANSRTNSQTTHPFVAQTRSIKDKPSGRVLPPPVLDRSCAPRSGRRQGRAKEWCPQIEQKNGSPYKEREKRKLGGSPVALLTGVRSYNPHSRCCSVGCPTPAISCLGASLTPAVGAWGLPSSSRRQRNLHTLRHESFVPRLAQTPET